MRSRVLRELQFASWDLLVRSGMLSDRFDAWVARTCPDLPDYRGREVTFSVVPSVLVGFVLKYYVPIVVGLQTWSLHLLGIALVGGRFACALAERAGLCRLDHAYVSWWMRRAAEPRPYVARAVAIGRRVAERSTRWALVALASGGVLAFAAVGARAATGATEVSMPIGICALLLVMSAMLLAVAILLGGIVETWAPIVLGPPSASAHVVSREDLRGLRPLLETWPIALARDAWDLLRTLRP